MRNKSLKLTLASILGILILSLYLISEAGIEKNQEILDNLKYLLIVDNQVVISDKEGLIKPLQRITGTVEYESAIIAKLRWGWVRQITFIIQAFVFILVGFIMSQENHKS